MEQNAKGTVATGVTLIQANPEARRRFTNRKAEDDE